MRARHGKQTCFFFWPNTDLIFVLYRKLTISNSIPFPLLECSSPISQEVQSERTFSIFHLFPDFFPYSSWFFPIFPDFSLFFPVFGKFFAVKGALYPLEPQLAMQLLVCSTGVSHKVKDGYQLRGNCTRN